MRDIEPYYWSALENEIATVWGAHPVGRELGVQYDLAGYSLLTTFYDGSFRDIELRREVLYAYMGQWFSTDSADDLLRMSRKRLPADSFVPRVTDALATLYNDPPVRRWVKGDVEDEAVTAAYRTVLRASGFDGRMQLAYRKAKLCSGVLLRPYIGARGRMQYEILTPDLCRWLTHPLFPDRITRLYRPLTRVVGDRAETVFEVWTDTEYHYEDHRGNQTWFYNEQEEKISGGDNPYGVVPYVVVRLVEPDTMETFSGGMMTVVEANVARNQSRFLADSSMAFESWGHWLAINLGHDAGRPRKMGFGRGTFLDDVPSEQVGNLAAPQLLNVATNGQYDRIDLTGRAGVDDVLRAAGLPESMIREQGGTPPSGVARIVERLGLLEMRQTDAELLRPAEQEIADMIARVWNADVVGKGVTGAVRLPEPGTMELQIEYMPERTYLEPKDLLETNMAALLAGVMSPARFLRDTVGVDKASDEEAVAYISENLQMIAAVRAAMAGTEPAPTSTTSVPTADVQTMQPDTPPAAQPDAADVATTVDPGADVPV